MFYFPTCINTPSEWHGKPTLNLEFSYSSESHAEHEDMGEGAGGMTMCVMGF